MATKPQTKRVRMVEGTKGVYLPTLVGGKVAMEKIRDTEPHDVVFGEPGLLNAAGSDRVLLALEAGLIEEVADSAPSPPKPPDGG